MFRTLLDFFGGSKIYEKEVPVQVGRLKVILKERRGSKYVYLRFSYTGNLQYHVLHEDDVGYLIDTLADVRTQYMTKA